MSTGAIIGIILTIVIAVISSQSGKKKVTRSQPHQVPPPIGNDDLPDFWEMMRRRLNEGDPMQPTRQPVVESDTEEIADDEAQSLEMPYTGHYQTIESASLEETTPEINHTKRGKYEAKPIEHISIMNENTAQQPAFDFDLRNAVIYSEILKPKHTEY